MYKKVQEILGMYKIDNWNCRLGHANHQVEMTSASQVCSNKISLSLIPPIHLTHTNTHIHTYKHTTCRENKRSRMGTVWYGSIYYVKTCIKEKDRYQKKKKILDFRVLELTENIFIKNSQDFLVVFWSHWIFQDTNGIWHFLLFNLLSFFQQQVFYFTFDHSIDKYKA